MVAFGFAISRPVGFPSPIAFDHATRRVGCVSCVADGAQRCTIQPRAIVQMEDEYRRFRRGVINLLQRRHSPLGKLELAPAADNTYPLRRRSALGLFSQHS